MNACLKQGDHDHGYLVLAVGGPIAICLEEVSV